MSQVVVPSKIVQIGSDKQEELEHIHDQLKIALRDYKTMITLLTDDPQNTFAKEEVYRLGLHINALAQNQKLILREIRKKCLDSPIAESAKPSEHKSLPMVQVEPNGASHEIMSSKEKENEKNTELKAINPPIKVELEVEAGNGFKKDLSENQEPELGKSKSVVPLTERAKHVYNMLPNNEAANANFKKDQSENQEPELGKSKTVGSLTERKHIYYMLPNNEAANANFKMDQSENQEPELGKSKLVVPLTERAQHVYNMLPNNEAANAKQHSASPSPNMKSESENEAAAAVKFLAVLELMPIAKLQQELRTKERRRAIRQKRSTANHSQFVYDDSWDQDDKKKKKKEKEKDVISPVSLKIAKPAPEILAEPPRPTNRKRGILFDKQGLSKPSSCATNGIDTFRPRKTLTPSILRSSTPKLFKPILPKPANPTVLKEAANEAIEPKIEQKGDEEKLIPMKTRKVISEPKKKRTSQKKAIDFSLEKLAHPGWNISVGTSQPREQSSFASNINSLIQASQVPPGLSLKIPGLPASLTIERISEQQRVCCMCRKPALVTGLFGDDSEKISDALTSCSDCGMTYHLSCTRSTSTSNEYHICPHCFTKQSTYPDGCPAVNFVRDHAAAKESRGTLIVEKVRLINEKESLDQKLLKLGKDVTCTFTSGGKTN